MRFHTMQNHRVEPPAVFSCIAKNSIRHFSQEPGNCESVKEGIGESIGKERERELYAYEESAFLSLSKDKKKSSKRSAILA